MKTQFLALLFAGIISSSSSFASGSHDGNEHHQEETSSVGSGVINSVNIERRTINVTHGPIPSLKWPGMTMDIAVAKDIDLKSLKAKQEIKFQIKRDDDDVFRINKIKNNH